MDDAPGLAAGHALQPPMLDCQRALFEIPPDVAYLNAAAYSPLPLSVRQAGEAGVATKSMPWQPSPAAWQDGAIRDAAARLIGAAADDIALVPSVSYGIATASQNTLVEPGTRILMMEGEFPSLALEWARAALAGDAQIDLVPAPADGDWTQALLDRIDQPGLPPVGVAALTPLHWTNGALVDLYRIAPALRRQGATLVVDATQAAGVLDLDVRRLKPDFMVFPTYKWLLGPYSLAFLYADPGRQGGRPLEQNGGSRIGGALPFSGHPAPFLPGARRYDVGERQNPVALPMALAGLGLLLDWGVPAIRARLRMVTDWLGADAAAYGFTALPAALRAPHILGLRCPAGKSPAALVARLLQDGVHVTERGGLLRVSPHVYNDEADLARFTRALRQAAA